MHLSTMNSIQKLPYLVPKMLITFVSINEYHIFRQCQAFLLVFLGVFSRPARKAKVTKRWTYVQWLLKSFSSPQGCNKNGF
jgi:hypothetical protein